MNAKKLTKTAAIDRHRVAKRLKSIRKRNGLSQAKFAKSLGCALGTYGRYEREYSDLPRPVQMKILQKYNEDPFDFASTSVERAPSPAPATYDERNHVAVSSYIKAVGNRGKKLRASQTRFLNEKYTKLGRRRVIAIDQLFLAVGLSFCFCLFAIELDLPLGPISNTLEFSMVISFLALICLIPVQLIGMLKFAMWQKHQEF